MKTVAVIQARMGSTRLPGKVLLPLAGETVLRHVVARVQACREVDEVLVATSLSPQDDAVEAEARRHGAGVFRGSETDVLSRYYHAAQQAGAEAVVRVTSDCPLFDPELLEAMLRRFQGGAALDYMSNVQERRYPRGLDAEVFTFEALAEAFRDAAQDEEREHVTPYIYRHPERFRIGSHVGAEDHSRHRWTLDTADDYRLLTAIFDALGGAARTADVLGLLSRHPELFLLNAHVEQKKLGE